MEILVTYGGTGKVHTLMFLVRNGFTRWPLCTLHTSRDTAVRRHDTTTRSSSMLQLLWVAYAATVRRRSELNIGLRINGRLSETAVVVVVHIPPSVGRQAGTQAPKTAMSTSRAKHHTRETEWQLAAWIEKNNRRVPGALRAKTRAIAEDEAIKTQREITLSRMFYRF